MKIIINRSVLTDALAQVMPFASQKNPLLILHYAKITTKGNRVKFESNDTRASMRRYVEAVDIDQDGCFLVDPTDVFALVSKCKDNDITLTIENESLTVKHSKGNAQFQVMPVEDYPDFDMPSDNITEITLPTSLLIDCIRVAKGFISSDELRPQLKAIYAFVKNGEYGYCATDTCKMAFDRNPIDGADGVDLNWYIEPSVFSVLSKACKDADNVLIKVSPTHVSYRIGNTVIQSVQTKGKFPDFNRVIPRDWNIECAVDKAELADSLKRTALQCEDNRLVKFSITRMDMAISADNIQKQKKASETLPHNGCNGELMLGLHVDYLLTCLDSCSTNEVVLRMHNASRPVLIHQSDKPNMVILLMPMAITN